MDFIELKSGTSVEDMKIKSLKTEGKFSKYIYLLAGVHGDEVEGVYVLQTLISWLEKNEGIELPFVIVPILNVDGYRVSTRINSHGVDLNRNLPTTNWSAEFQKQKYNPGEGPLSEPENKYLKKLFDKYLPGIIISIHSWKPLINFNGDCKDIADYLSSINEYSAVDSVGYETPGSLGEFAPEEYNCPVITYELPKLRDKLLLKDIWFQNEKSLLGLLSSDKLLRFL